MNKKIKEFAKMKKIELIDNSNLDTSCLSRRMLHLSEKGNSYLANNFINFMKTLWTAERTKPVTQTSREHDGMSEGPNRDYKKILEEDALLKPEKLWKH